ncbi:response regulator transcription factor [Enterococcus sp. 669A]|uniref:Response regulator transcription factor n=1 Tax=Candidatus Enterococcus moelleringii TaxID=2815325 RepID=A0ABS3LB95_9ENTE|nr:LytTR family DNA-binding domain-containing protein [Enterococcus sp. 669A]MBO1306891.1 response regulator transcription factor [Enterococcus sp. 669A]
MNVIICDDDQFFCQQLEDYVDAAFADFGQSYNCDVYYSGEELLAARKALEEPIQVYLLDIELPGIDGLSLAAEIRREDSQALIIFVTSHEEEMPRAFDVAAFHFIIKPLQPEKVLEVLKRAKEHFIRSKRTFQFIIRKRRYTLFAAEIAYFISQGRKVSIHTTSGKVYEYYGTLDEAEEQLGMSTFLRIHKSYLVNVDYFLRVESKKVIMQDGELLPISKRYHSAFHQNYRTQLLSI